MASKRYRPWNPDQAYLFLPSMSHGRMEREVERLEKEIQELYSCRKVIVEPVFGHIKEPRGFRPFPLRGVFKVRQKWTLVCLCHNLLRLLAPQPDLAES